MRLELTRVGLLVKLANHYTTLGALLKIFTSGLTFRMYLFRVKPPTEFHMTKNLCTPYLAVVVKYARVRHATQLKVRIEEHQKAVVRGEILKSVYCVP